jgi:hypothetical protein
VVGISLGGRDLSITNNFVQGASTAGISFAVSSLGPAKGLRIIGNTTKNNGQGFPGAHAGIELYLGFGSGGSSLASLSDVIVQGNHSYDDQAVKTQGYGVGVALGGLKMGYSNVIIEGNDVAGNLLGGVLNNAAPLSAFAIRNNLGHNPLARSRRRIFPQVEQARRSITVATTSLYTSHPELRP